jgi:hypothetical protein
MNPETKAALLKEAAEVDALLEGDMAVDPSPHMSSAADPQFLFDAFTRSYYVLAEQTMATQHRVIREYAESVQRHTNSVLQLWLDAWALLSEALVPVMGEEALAPLSAEAAAAPASAQGLARAKRSSRHNGRERRASAT